MIYVGFNNLELFLLYFVVFVGRWLVVFYFLYKRYRRYDKEDRVYNREKGFR